MIQNCMKQKIEKIIINEPLFVVYLAGVLKRIVETKWFCKTIHYIKIKESNGEIYLLSVN